jgi:hypothetical protein
MSNSTYITQAQVSAIRRIARSKRVHQRTLVPVYNSSRPSDAPGLVKFLAEYRENEDGATFSSESRVEIPALVKIEDYRPGRSVTEGAPLRLVCSQTDYFGERSLSGLANVLRAGDQLQIRFLIGNTTGALKDAGFSTDECEIAVYRNGKFFTSVPVDSVTYPVNNISYLGMVCTSFKGEAE